MFSENTFPETSLFVDVLDKKGKQVAVRKSTLICSLTSETQKLSNDRLRRVQGPAIAKHRATLYPNPIKRKKPRNKRYSLRTSSYSKKTKSKGKNIYKSEMINVGDWCFFKKDFQKSIRRNTLDYVVFGCILSLRFGKSKDKQFNKLKQKPALVTEKYVLLEEEEDNKFNIKVLGAWYSYTLENSFYFDYIATCKSQPLKNIDNKNMMLSLEQEDVDEIVDLSNH